MSERLGLDDEELYIIFARRLGPIDNGRRHVRKRPILCTFSHYSEVDLVMSETRRLRNTGYAVDRDYPPEIAAARKKLWPDVKQRRSAASSSDSIQLKFPAKIVVNGQVVRDEFPHWQETIKSNLDSDFRFILQEDMLRGSAGFSTGFPTNVHSQNTTTQSVSVPRQLPNMHSQNIRAPVPAPSTSIKPNCDNFDRTIFRIPDIPPLPPPHMLLIPSGLPQAASQLPRQPRPPSPYMASEQDNQTINPFVTPCTVNESQQSQFSPSLLSGNLQQNNPDNSRNIPSENTNNTTSSNTGHNTQASARSVSRNSSTTRDRSLSADKQGARGRPRNVSQETKTRPRSRSRSVKSNSSSKGLLRDTLVSGGEHVGPGPGTAQQPSM